MKLCKGEIYKKTIMDCLKNIPEFRGLFGGLNWPTQETIAEGILKTLHKKIAATNEKYWLINYRCRLRKEWIFSEEVVNIHPLLWLKETRDEYPDGDYYIISAIEVPPHLLHLGGWVG